MRRFILFIILLAVAAGAAWWFGVWPFGGKAPDHAAVPSKGGAPIQVSTTPVQRADVPLTVELVGAVIARQTVAVRTRLDSQITAVHVQDGAHVEQGALLFTLDNRTPKAQADELAANIKRDEALLASVKTTYERSQQLAERGYATREKLDQDRANFESQQAALIAARASLENIRVQLDYARIRAPITGRLGTINVTLGNTVRPADAQPLVTINQIDPILVQFSVPQRYFDQIQQALRQGATIVTAQRQGGEAVEGQLDSIDNAIDARSGTFIARARFANADEKLWPGMFVTVRVTLGVTQGALTLPAAALQGGEDQRFVFIVDPATSKAVRRDVALDRIAGDQAILNSGVSDGEQVITDGLLRVSDGAAVKTQGAATGQ
jgi:multidrug efflux system membrane fusion protein